jgi:hypothetical protein
LKLKGNGFAVRFVAHGHRVGVRPWPYPVGKSRKSRTFLVGSVRYIGVFSGEMATNIIKQIMKQIMKHIIKYIIKHIMIT